MDNVNLGHFLPDTVCACPDNMRVSEFYTPNKCVFEDGPCKGLESHLFIVYWFPTFHEHATDTVHISPAFYSRSRWAALIIERSYSASLGLLDPKRRVLTAARYFRHFCTDCETQKVLVFVQILVMCRCGDCSVAGLHSLC